jgi:hypothetical protein
MRIAAPRVHAIAIKKRPGKPGRLKEKAMIVRAILSVLTGVPDYGAK